MADKNILKHLGNLKGAWNKAKARAHDKGGAFENLPDGKYIAQLAGAELGMSSSDKPRFQCKFEYAVLEGEQQGQTIYKYMGLTDEQSLDWMCKELVRLGIDASQMEADELPGALVELLKAKPTVRLKLRTKGEYQNCYIEKLVDSDGGDAAPAEEAAEASEEAVEEESADATVEAGVTELTFTFQGKECQSVVSKIADDGRYVVEVGGKKYFKKAEECTVVVAEAAEEEAAEEEAAEEEAVEEEVVVEKPKPGVKPKPKPKAEPAPVEEQEVEIAIGMKVEFKHKGKKLISTIKKIDEKKGLITVVAGKETITVKPEDLTLIPEGKDK